MTRRAIALGAGKVTRMKSNLATVLQRVAGRPLIGWVFAKHRTVIGDGVRIGSAPCWSRRWRSATMPTRVPVR